MDRDVGVRLHIGFVGNTNNYPFSVARAFRDMGHEVVQFVDSTERLNRPEGRYADMGVPYPDWIVDISSHRVRDMLFPTSRQRTLKKALTRFDLLVLNGQGMALASGAGRPAFCLLTGSDLEYMANWASLSQEFTSSRKRASWLRALLSASVFAGVVRRQRACIRRAFGVNYFAKTLAPVGDRLLETLGVGPDRRTAFMISDVSAIQPRARPVNAGQRLRVFNVARLNWQLPRPKHLSDLDMKGTDVLLRGFAQFAAVRDVQAELVLVGKGHDVSATKALAAQLGIDTMVTWLDEMTQAAVFEQYALADVVAEQLSTSVVGMGGLDAMAAGRPVIANARPEVFEKLIGEPSAVLQATTSEEVCIHLCRLADDPVYRADVGRQSRDYVERHFSPRAAALQILDRWRFSGGAMSPERPVLGAHR